MKYNLEDAIQYDFIFQQGAARIAEEEKRVRESKGEECDMTLKNNIEGIIIKWAYQTDEVQDLNIVRLNVPFCIFENIANPY